MVLLPDDLKHLPSDPGDQEFLLRLLVHLARANGRVERRQKAFIEAVAEKTGRVGWELPEEAQTLAPDEIAKLHTRWTTTDAKLWLVNLVRSLAAVDGLIDRDEEMVLEQVAGVLFSSCSSVQYEVPFERIDDRERALIAAASRAASLSDTQHWHRKTGKVVGAAVGVEQDGSLRVFSGVNFELSQPTGSRCAEQIALGSALVHFGNALRLSDVRMIAVVAGSNVPKPVSNPLPPCGVCCEMIHKLNDADQIRLYMLADSAGSGVIRIPFSEYYPPRVA